ncbi:hypothetical protein A2Z23_02750 [Candidatus Curtissbacteria bacterium RBG_16_39_7]|uniref:Uncharacterized protein n=1 Tax=Candidatus Curtissbacteria bacterium RBG_16_39_7 TaxID=1797707 RepID=A0A1F5G4F8_9BACT|nr:MAG: hypothetical protein A2Z23_02750 [Candidatus Curtissbacteria bacterium RBG_16_39_7]
MPTLVEIVPTTTLVETFRLTLVVLAQTLLLQTQQILMRLVLMVVALAMLKLRYLGTEPTLKMRQTLELQLITLLFKPTRLMLKTTSHPISIPVETKPNTTPEVMSQLRQATQKARLIFQPRSTRTLPGLAEMVAAHCQFGSPETEQNLTTMQTLPWHPVT